jgi:hypothetical protein
MGTVLDGLDRVDWARLTHAYGVATDVPDQIRALHSADPAARQQALYDLYGNIFHQGTRYEATAYAVPFLLEALADPTRDDRAEMLRLLSGIATGYDEGWLPAAFPIAEYRRAAEGGDALLAAAPHPGDDDYDDDTGDYEYVETLTAEDQTRLYTHIELAAYDAVRAGIPLLRSLLFQTGAAVRIGAAYALAAFGEDAAGSLPALAAAADPHPADPRDPAFAATLIVAAGLLGGRPDPAALGHPDASLRWGAAVASAAIDRHDTSAAVVAELIAQLAAERDDRVPFLGGDRAGYAAIALGQVGPPYPDAVFDGLLARVPHISGPAALNLVGAALRQAFPAGRLAADTPFGTLDDRQRRLVSALAGSPSTWQISGMEFGNFTLLVGSYGLPVSCAKLAAYTSE